MTDKEIIQELRCGEDANGTTRPEPSDGEIVCYDTLKLAAADLIERDQKEIEALRAALEKATEMADALNKKCDLITKKLEQYRALIPSWVIPMPPKEETP